ncbi:hypothetical protein [Actinokineospora terrae]|uniref:Uncharacterized protein n=1 Tax=Actinokineospora terrae TaxID=155974 RepID=A0A1H9VVA8_9PSEU|nr:hypothetical protein [Actinokineospora terrae]SES25605.1 hypothetical protein SAMN04487818_109115 [Actinokineospora terrae]
MRPTGELALLRESVRPGRLTTWGSMPTRPPRGRELGLPTRHPSGRRILLRLPRPGRRPRPRPLLTWLRKLTWWEMRHRLGLLTRGKRSRVRPWPHVRHRLRLLTGRRWPELLSCLRRSELRRRLGLLGGGRLPGLIALPLGPHLRLREVSDRLGLPIRHLGPHLLVHLLSGQRLPHRNPLIGLFGLVMPSGLRLRRQWLVGLRRGGLSVRERAGRVLGQRYLLSTRDLARRHLPHRLGRADDLGRGGGVVDGGLLAGVGRRVEVPAGRFWGGFRLARRGPVRHRGTSAQSRYLAGGGAARSPAWASHLV